MATAVVMAMVLSMLMPASVRLGPNWLLPSIEGVLLVALIVGDPGKISRRTTLLRGLSIALVSILVLSALWGTAILLAILVQGGAETNSADTLLAMGSTVWLYNNIAFGLLYWEMDSGGAAVRAHHSSPYPDLAFPQQLNPHVAPPGWRPRFVDYLYLAFTNAVAFSPTDVMPLTEWPKVTMVMQALVSLVILALVIARAVNVFT
jgi:uncharacterized membrane protein